MTETRTGAVCLKCGADVLISSPMSWPSILGPTPVWMHCHCQTLELTDTVLQTDIPVRKGKSDIKVNRLTNTVGDLNKGGQK